MRTDPWIACYCGSAQPVPTPAVSLCVWPVITLMDSNVMIVIIVNETSFRLIVGHQTIVLIALSNSSFDLVLKNKKPRNCVKCETRIVLRIDNKNMRFSDTYIYFT